MFRYLIGKLSRKDVTTEERESKKKVTFNVKELYLVMQKNNAQPLGIYDTLEDAKEAGRKATYCSCYILKFQMNEPCKFLNNPVYEDVN